MAKTPDRLNVDKADRKLYDRIGSELFDGKTRKEQFLFAMAYGVRSRTRRSLNTRDGFFFTKDLHPEDESLINAVALNETGSAEVLADRNAVYTIVEEYAHAGIRLLHDEATSGQPGSFFKSKDFAVRFIQPAACSFDCRKGLGFGAGGLFYLPGHFFKQLGQDILRLFEGVQKGLDASLRDTF